MTKTIENAVGLKQQQPACGVGRTMSTTRRTRCCRTTKPWGSSSLRIMLWIACLCSMGLVWFSTRSTTTERGSAIMDLEMTAATISTMSAPVTPFDNSGIATNTIRGTVAPSSTAVVNRMINNENHTETAQERPTYDYYNQTEALRNGFAACLLMKDDNHHLVEWLAYHYQFLPLRRLIIAIDPKSVTSPTKILERWRSRNLMEITELHHDEDYLPQTIINKWKHDDHSLHLKRQSRMLRYCLGTLRKERRWHWVAVIDTDEFIVPNPQANEARRFRDVPISDRYYNTDNNSNSTVKPVSTTTTTALDYLTSPQNQEVLKNVMSNDVCFCMHRSQVSSKESHPDQVQEKVPAPFNGTDFLTLRYRHSTTSQPGSEFPWPGKSIVIVSRANPRFDFQPANFNIHRPFKSHCDEKAMWRNRDNSPLVTYHYAGTYEQYIARPGDNTRFREMYEAKTNYSNLEDDNARFWLQGFVDQVGLSLSQELLQGAGQVDPLLKKLSTSSPGGSSAVMAPEELPLSSSATQTPHQEEVNSNTTDTIAETNIYRLLETQPLGDFYNRTEALRNGVAACLLMKDDNHHLIEWLAYHYHFLPLRRLIIAIDPKSVTSPTEILERWRSRNLIEITELHDEDYLPQHVIDKFGHNGHSLHLHRQTAVLQYCLGTLRNEHRWHWVAVVDTDEFIVPNWQAIPAFRFTDVAPMNRYYQNDKNNNNDSTKPNTTTTALDYLTSLENEAVVNRVLAHDLCFTMHRSQVSSKESRLDQIQAHVPATLNATDFLTMRYRHSTSHQHNKPRVPLPGKSMVIVSKTNPREDFGVSNFNIHRPFINKCEWNALWKRRQISPLVTYHYAGTYEQYMARPGDVTRYRESFEMKANHSDEEDDNARFWLQGFVDQVGIELSQKLLQGAGQVDPLLKIFPTSSPGSSPTLAREELPLSSSASQMPHQDKVQSNTTVATAETNIHTLFENQPPGDFYNRTEALRNGVAACLLMKDDNHHLIEWLAYHYHFLPLRRLIIAIDPKSITNPTEILQRWRSRNLMEITELHDEDYLPQHVIDKFGHKDYWLHLHRQNGLLQYCLGTLRKEQRWHWVAVVDTDEFIVPNLQAIPDFRFTDVAPTNRYYDSNENNDSTKSNTTTTALDYLTSPENQAVVNRVLTRDLCFTMSRSQVSSKESRPDQIQAHVPAPLNATDFLTMRYRHSTPHQHNNTRLNWPGKSMVIVSKANPKKDFGVSNFNMHRPFLNKCERNAMWKPRRMSPLVTYHYAGTYEQYMARPGDVTRYREIYEMKTNHSDEEDDNARFWLQGFVDQVGLSLAQKLLRGAGQVDPLLQLPAGTAPAGSPAS